MRVLKFAMAIVGAVILIAGIVGTVLVTQAQANMTSQMINECTTNPISSTCLQLGLSIATYGLYFWLAILIGIIGVIILILGIVLGAVASSPETPTAAYPPQPVAYPGPAAAPASSGQTAPCVRCGRPARWVPAYNRWYCDAEQMYV